LNRIILGTDDMSLKTLFHDRFPLQVTDFSDLFPEDGDNLSEKFFFVLDLHHFEKLTEDSLKKTEGHPVLLLLSAAQFQDSDLLPERSGLSVFFYQTESEISARNLFLLLETMLEKTVLSGRLDSYIKDSFSDIVDTNLLYKQKQEIEELNEKLGQISRVDYLTNLLNRRALLESFEQEKRRALRFRWRLRNAGSTEPGSDEGPAPNDFDHVADGDLQEHLGNFACLMIDIDHFKKVNDTYGHLMGDEVLRRFGELARQKGLFRDTDVLGRYGGEEFVILLPETNCVHALIPAQRFRKAIKDIGFVDTAGRSFSITISIGVSEFLPEEVTSEEMIKRADDALYYAKDHGRDQVCLYDSGTGTISAAP
jgi:diguanylate cyclase (GGDEF)-like protein